MAVYGPRIFAVPEFAGTLKTAGFLRRQCEEHQRSTVGRLGFNACKFSLQAVQELRRLYLDHRQQLVSCRYHCHQDGIVQWKPYAVCWRCPWLC